MSELSKRIEEFINALKSKSYRPISDKSYQEIFAGEGYEKAQYIIKDLEEKASEHNVNLSGFGLLSIGGADGSEAEEILRRTPIKKAILLERDDGAAEKAREKARLLSQEIPNKSLIVLQGDALDRLEDALFELRRDCTGIVCSAQAILHELPNRSARFESYSRLIGEIFKDFDSWAFYAREPCKPSSSWPGKVRVSFPDVNGDALAELAELIAYRLGIESEIRSSARNQVLMSGELAIEILHKVLRSRDPSELIKEVEEQLTFFDPEDFSKAIRSYFPEAEIVWQRITTNGFGDAYKKAKVSIIDDTQHQMITEIPLTHVKIMIFRGAAKTSKSLENENDVPSLQPSEAINQGVYIRPRSSSYSPAVINRGDYKIRPHNPSYSAKARNHFYDNLGTDWERLADYFDIPGPDRDMFRNGRQARDLWRWLEQRKKLYLLESNLKEINRSDLVEELQQN